MINFISNSFILRIKSLKVYEITIIYVFYPDAYFIIGKKGEHDAGPSGDGVMIANEKGRYKLIVQMKDQDPFPAYTCEII
jgi:hypothetical protein